MDSEFKILADIQNRLGNNFKTTGKIKLFTVLSPSPSCDDVIRQFKELYKNIDIEVVYKIKK